MNAVKWTSFNGFWPNLVHTQSLRESGTLLIFKVKGQNFFLSVWTNFQIFCPISTNFVEFKIMMCELCSIKDFIVHWVLPLLCLFGLGNFETIQYALCHRKFSYMINQKFMKLCSLQDPNMKMCTLVGYWFSRSKGHQVKFFPCNILVKTLELTSWTL